MQLVIDIPDKYMKGKKVENGSLACEYILEAVYNGTPLPKGHGRLIILSEDKLKENQLNFEFSCQKWITEVGISNATVTIVETDKVESENKE